MSILQMKMVSSLEKCFWSDAIESKKEKNEEKRRKREFIKVIQKNLKKMG